MAVPPPDCVIEQDAPRPVVLMQTALLGLVGAAVEAKCRPAMYNPPDTPENCTTEHLELLQTKRFWPPRFAIWTTVCRVLAQVQRVPGQRAPA